MKKQHKIDLILLTVCLLLLALFLLTCTPPKRDYKQFPPPSYEEENETNQEWEQLMKELRHRPPEEHPNHIQPGAELRKQDVPLPPKPPTDDLEARALLLLRHQFLNSGGKQLLDRMQSGTALIGPAHVKRAVGR